MQNCLYKWGKYKIVEMEVCILRKWVCCFMLEHWKLCKIQLFDCFHIALYVGQNLVIHMTPWWMWCIAGWIHPMPLCLLNLKQWKWWEGLIASRTLKIMDVRKLNQCAILIYFCNQSVCVICLFCSNSQSLQFIFILFAHYSNMVSNIKMAPVVFRLLLILVVCQRVWPYLLLLSLRPLADVLLAQSDAGYAFYLRP